MFGSHKPFASNRVREPDILREARIFTGKYLHPAGPFPCALPKGRSSMKLTGRKIRWNAQKHTPTVGVAGKSEKNTQKQLLEIMGCLQRGHFPLECSEAHRDLRSDSTDEKTSR